MPLVLLTGATRGIGHAAAVQLAERGADLALAGRDPERVAETAAAARAAGAQVSEHVADLTSMAEVRRLAAEVRERHERVDVLANNAGAMFTTRHVTADGFERTFALNHLAPFLLTQLLLDRLEGGRVVTTASDAHTAGALDFADLQSERWFKPMRTYGTTKLCNILFTRELARREAGRLVANCFHPGVVRTGFGKNDGALYKLGLTLAGPFLRSPDRGARSLVWLARSEEAGRLTGAYVVDEKVATPSPAAQDDALAAELWRRSEELVSTMAA
jgi:NAD(P)-dependent dehydrogenase (short-subunit alcohol dehydrogenase family)